MNIVWVQVYRVRNRSELGGYADQSWPYRPVHRSAGQGRQYRGARLACPRLSQVFCQAGELQGWKIHKERDRGGVGGCLSLKESCGVKCAGAVSAVFRGESLLGELWGRQYSWRGRLASAEKWRGGVNKAEFSSWAFSKGGQQSCRNSLSLAWT